MLSFALLAGLMASARFPGIFRLVCSDTDDRDRSYGAGDTFTVVFSTYELVEIGVCPACATYPQTVWGTVSHDETILSKAQVDAILSFSVKLGEDYQGEWIISAVDTLVITVLNPTGADVERIAAFDFNVSCVPGVIGLEPDPYAITADETCTTVGHAPATGSDWGRGRPSITSVLSISAEPDRLLAAGDRIRIVFDAEIDVSAASAGGLSGADLVEALFSFEGASLGGSYVGAWLNSSCFEITFVAPPGNAQLPRGDDFAIGCRPGAPLKLLLPANAIPSESAPCCFATPTASTLGNCEPIPATGSFGTLPDGPYLLSAVADDPDDGDDSLSIGDTLMITFSTLTSTPAIALTNAEQLFDFFTADAPDEAVDLGVWVGEWGVVTAGSSVNTTLKLTFNRSYAAASGIKVPDLFINCRPFSNITAEGREADGTPTSLDCGHTTAHDAPDGVADAVQLSGDFGADAPMIINALASDPDDSDAVFSAGDALYVTFSVATDLAGYGDATLTKAEVDRLLIFSPPLPDDADYTATFDADRRHLNITWLQTGYNASTPTSVACACRSGLSGTHCRDADGIHDASAAGPKELSCPPVDVAFDAASSWGEHPGPTIVAVVAGDEDNFDAVFGNGDTIDIIFDQPTDLGGLQLGTSYPRAIVLDLFEFDRNFGQDFTGTWISNVTFQIRIVNKRGTDMRISTRLLTNCNPNTAYPIRDHLQRFLPSVCHAETISGSFGALEPPELKSVTADDPDDADGILSAGDVITLRWAAPTDRGWTLQDGEDPCSPSSPPVAVPPAYLEGVDQLLFFQLPGETSPPSAPGVAAAPPPPAVALPLDVTALWTGCDTLRLTVGTTPAESLRIGAGLLLTLTGAGGEREDGIRNAISESQHATGSMEVGGSFGELPGPILASAVAHDADSLDAIFGVYDTLTLHFLEPTDMGGHPAGVDVTVDGWVDGPAAPDGTFVGTWINASALQLRVISVSGVDVAAWSATVSARNLTLTAAVRLLPAANVVNAARTSLASDTSASVVGSWGDRPGPFPTYLVADGGSGADAIYSAGDTISISFSEPTDSGGVPIGQPLADETLEALLACHLLDDETLDGEQTPFPLSSFGQLSTEWTSPSVLTLTVVDAATASTLLTVPSYTGLGVPSMLGQLACCIRPDGLIRNAAVDSHTGSGCSSALSGHWGRRVGPKPAKVSLSDPYFGGSDLGVGDVLTITFDEPTDRGGVPIGWTVPSSALSAGIRWRHAQRPTEDLGLYEGGQGRWTSDTDLEIQITRLHHNASSTSDALCSGYMQATVLQSLGVRDLARISEPSFGLVSLLPADCEPGSGPAVYAAGYASDGLLGLDQADVLDCPGYRTSASPVFLPMTSSAVPAPDQVVTALAAADLFSLMLLDDGIILLWGKMPIAGTPTASTPEAVGLPGSEPATAICAGAAFALVLLTNGTVCGLGSDDQGQLHGAGSEDAPTLQARALPGMPRMRAIACGARHALLVAADSDAIYTLGESDAGQLGRPTAALPTSSVQSTYPSWIPDEYVSEALASERAMVLSNGAHAVVAVEAGRDHSVVLLASGAICSWGGNYRKQLGPVYDSTGSLPSSTAGLTSAMCFELSDGYGRHIPVSSIAAGDYHSLAITVEGVLYSWGHGIGASGDATSDSATPQQPLDGYAPSGTFVRTAGAGGTHSIATTTRGEVWAWGANEDGELGGGCGSLGAVTRPVRASGIGTDAMESWRVQAAVAPLDLSPLNLFESGAPTRAPLEILIHPDVPAMLSIAGVEAPCRAACELSAAMSESDATYGGCVAFTHPQGGAAWDCAFFQAAEEVHRVTFPTTPAASTLTLHSLESRERGGAKVATAGSRHTVVAVGLTPAERCPAPLGTDQFTARQCGGADQGSCVYGLCVCKPPWVGDGCSACGSTCNFLRGSCGLDGAGNPACICEVGWGGDDCNEPACPSYAGVVCAGHGVCSGPPSARVCDCEEDWVGDSCEVPLCSTSPLNSCSNGNTAVSAQCGCDSADFATDGLAACVGPTAQKCFCADGYAGASCQLSCPTLNGVQCGGHGRCTTVATTPDLSVACECDAGFRGDQCTSAICPGSPNACSGRGQCLQTANSATCSCDVGFVGADCSGYACLNDCSGYGRCKLESSGAVCECVYGRSGDDCSVNAGDTSLTYILSIVGSMLFVTLVGGFAIYWCRARQHGQFLTPGDTYRRRQWANAGRNSLGVTVAIHTPRRDWNAPRPAGLPTGKGTRTRVGPVVQ